MKRPRRKFLALVAMVLPGCAENKFRNWLWPTDSSDRGILKAAAKAEYDRRKPLSEAAQAMLPRDYFK